MPYLHNLEEQSDKFKMGSKAVTQGSVSRSNEKGSPRGAIADRVLLCANIVVALRYAVDDRLGDHQVVLR